MDDAACAMFTVEAALQHPMADGRIEGATGFVGALIAEYLTQNDDSGKIQWALAGRNRDKLAAAIAFRERARPGGGGRCSTSPPSKLQTPAMPTKPSACRRMSPTVS